MPKITDPALLSELNGGGQTAPQAPTIYRTPSKPTDQLRVNADVRAENADRRAERSSGIAEQLAEITITEKKAKLAKEREEQALMGQANDTTIAAIRKTIAELDQIKTDTKGDYFETGTTGNIARAIPLVGNDAKGLEARLKGIKGQNAFAALQSLAAQGVKLTPISNAEIDLAASSVANLDPTQSEEIFLGQLQKAREFYKTSLDRLEANRAPQTPLNQPEAQQPTAPASGVSDDETNAQVVLSERYPDYKPGTEFFDRNGEVIGFESNDGEGVIIIDPSGINAEIKSRKERLETDADTLDGALGEGGLKQRASLGSTLGFQDEISGITGGVIEALQGGEFSEGYADARDVSRIRQKRTDERTGIAGDIAEIGGSLLLPGMGAAKAGGAIRQGAKAGALSGGIAGFGYGEGATNSLKLAAGGAAAGGVLGGVIPGAISASKPTINALSRFAGRNKNVAINQVRNALTADGNTARSVGKEIASAQSRKSPTSIADTGENSRQLLASVTRQPGPARRLGVETTAKRQEEQLERISAAVRRDLGPTANIRDLGDEIIDKARVKAKPLYEAAYNNPGAGALLPTIKPMLARPAMQKALKNAEKIIKEEGGDPKSLGFNLSDDGEVILSKAPSWQTLDYVKRGMDDVIEKYRDSTTGRLVLDGQGRAANNTLRSFLTKVDKANPEYAAARAAYAGPAKMKDALNKGAKALRKSPDDIAAEMKNLSPSEKEMYRTGVRKGVVSFLEGKGDYADKVNALIGTQKSRKALSKVFGGKSGFDRFVKTLQDEREIGLTYKAVNTGSPTAMRMNFDSNTGGQRILSSAIDVAESGNRGGAAGAVGTAVRKIREAGTLGTGKAGDEARESIAALLSETDPAELSLIIKSARRLAANDRLLKRKQIRNAGRQGNAAGRGAVISTKDLGAK